MPTRKPLVIINGLQFQLPDADLLGAISLGVGFESVNSFPTAIAKATPVVVGLNGFNPARANSVGLAMVAGLTVADFTVPNASSPIQTNGLFAATINQWNVITGLSSGLSTGQTYYLSPNPAGRITTVPPSEGGSFLVRVGFAISPTQLRLDLQPPIGM